METKHLDIIKDDKGRIVKRPILSYGNYYSKYEKIVYDSNNNVTKKEVFDFSDALLFEEINEYGINNNITKSTRTYYEKANIPETIVYTYIYDDKNNLIKETCLLQGDDQTGLSEFKERNWILDADITEHEYDENNNCIKLISKSFCDEISKISEYEFENNKLVKIVDKDIDGNIIDDYVIEYISDNEIKTTYSYDIDGERYCNITTEEFDSDENLIKRIIQDNEGDITTYIYDKNQSSPIEEIYKSEDFESRVSERFNENGVLEFIEIEGNKEIVITEKNQQFLQEPLILKYDHFKERMIRFVMVLPILLLLVVVGLFMAFILVETSRLISMLAFVLSLVLAIVIVFVPISLIKNKNKLLKYELNTLKQTITFYNAELFYKGELSIKDKPAYYTPVILHFNAIKEAEFVFSASNCYADRLYLTLNENDCYSIFATRKILKTLEKFIPIKNSEKIPLLIKINGLY